MKIVFTRHVLTPIQDAEIRAASGGEGYLHRADLASRNIMTMDNAREICNELLAMFHNRVSSDKTCSLYGVFPTPLRAVFFEIENEDGWRTGTPIYIFESFNINRAAEGQPPQFEHAGWLKTGMYVIPT